MNTSIHTAKRASVGIAAAFKAQAEDAAAAHMLSWLTTELADLRAARVAPPKVCVPPLINYGNITGGYAYIGHPHGGTIFAAYGHPVKVTRVRHGHRTLHMSFTYGGTGQHSLTTTAH